MKAAVLILLCVRGSVAGWTKVAHMHCDNQHGHYPGIIPAMQACLKSNPPCRAVYDPGCDGKGIVYICRQGAVLKPSTINSCIYQTSQYNKHCTCRNGIPVVGARYMYVLLIVYPKILFATLRQEHAVRFPYEVPS